MLNFAISLIVLFKISTADLCSFGLAHGRTEYIKTQTGAIRSNLTLTSARINVGYCVTEGANIDGSGSSSFKWVCEHDQTNGSYLRKERYNGALECNKDKANSVENVDYLFFNDVQALVSIDVNQYGRPYRWNLGRSFCFVPKACGLVAINKKEFTSPGCQGSALSLRTEFTLTTGKCLKTKMDAQLCRLFNDAGVDTSSLWGCQSAVTGSYGVICTKNKLYFVSYEKCNDCQCHFRSKLVETGCKTFGNNTLGGIASSWGFVIGGCGNGEKTGNINVNNARFVSGDKIPAELYSGGTRIGLQLTIVISLILSVMF